MANSAATERRQGRRYLVVGKAVVCTSWEVAEAELVNVGSGGLLAFSESSFPLGERVDVRFSIQGYPLEVQVKGRVVQTVAGLLGIGFLEEKDALDEVLLWLEADFTACLL